MMNQLKRCSAPIYFLSSIVSVFIVREHFVDDSVRKLSYFSLQRTKPLYQNIFRYFTVLFTCSYG